MFQPVTLVVGDIPVRNINGRTIKTNCFPHGMICEMKEKIDE